MFLRQFLACELRGHVRLMGREKVRGFHGALADSLNLGFEEEPDYAMMRGMCR